MASLKIYSPGTEVRIKEADIDGLVTAVQITSRRNYKYRVTWWNGNTRNCEWMESFEIEKTGAQKSMSVGFKPEEQ